MTETQGRDPSSVMLTKQSEAEEVCIFNLIVKANQQRFQHGQHLRLGEGRLVISLNRIPCQRQWALQVWQEVHGSAVVGSH